MLSIGVSMAMPVQREARSKGSRRARNLSRFRTGAVLIARDLKTRKNPADPINRPLSMTQKAEPGTQPSVLQTALCS